MIDDSSSAPPVPVTAAENEDTAGDNVESLDEVAPLPFPVHKIVRPTHVRYLSHVTLPVRPGRSLPAVYVESLEEDEADADDDVDDGAGAGAGSAQRAWRWKQQKLGRSQSVVAVDGLQLPVGAVAGGLSAPKTPVMDALTHRSAPGDVAKRLQAAKAPVTETSADVFPDGAVGT